MGTWNWHPRALNARISAIGKLMLPVSRGVPDVVLHAMRVSVWGRWFIWLVGAVMLARRPDLWYPGDIWYVYFNVVLAATNGFLHHRLLTNRPVTWRWMLVMSAVDIWLITAHIVVNGRFDNLFFVVYYPSLAMFAVVFSSLWVILAWVTATAVVYFLAVVLAGPGVDLELGQDHVLAARLTVMYLIPAGCQSHRAVRKNQMAECGIQRAADATGTHRSIPEDPRHCRPERVFDRFGIAQGQETGRRFRFDARCSTRCHLRSLAFDDVADQGTDRRGSHRRGRELGRVLWSHCKSFETISGIPTEVSQSGDEPPLPREVRSGLFSVAHNALTNAFLHASASSVAVRLGYEDDLIRLSVSDDGVGLPDDYAERGRGFDGMKADAERMRATLIVESGEHGRGTTITCIVPGIEDRGER